MKVYFKNLLYHFLEEHKTFLLVLKLNFYEERFFGAKTKTPLDINTMFSLLRDKVSTFDMQAHLMHLNMKCTRVLNPGQTSVDVSNQPAYALTKELQFRHPEICSQYFTIFRQLHIEKLYWQFIDS